MGYDDDGDGGDGGDASGEIPSFTIGQAQALVEDAVRRSSPRHEMWRQLERMFRSGRTDQASMTQAGLLVGDGLDEITLDAINYCLPHLSIIIETVAARDPEMMVEPVGGGPPADKNATVGQHLLHHFWRRQEVTSRVLRDVTQDAVVLGNGFGKVGWDHAEEEVDRDSDELAEELADLLEHDELAAELEDRDPLATDDLMNRLTLTESRILKDEPYVEYVSPFDVFVPDDARRMEETPWVAQRLVMRADEVRANDLFDDEAKDALTTIYSYDSENDHRIEGGGQERGSQRAGEGDFAPFEVAVIYEFYDLRARRLMVFQLDCYHALYDDALPYSHRYAPFIHMRSFNDGGSRFWSFGHLENIASLQHQVNEYVHFQHDNAQRSGNKTFVRKDLLTKEVREALESSESDVVVPIELGQEPLENVVKTVERQGLSRDVYAAKDEATVAMREVLGLNDFQTGGSGADRMSATAAAVVDGTSTLRAGSQQKQVELAAKRIAKLMLLLCQEFLDAKRAIRVAGPEGAEWLDVTADDLIGEYDVEIEVGSTQAVNPSTRQQRAIDMLSNVIPALEAAGYDTHPMWRQIMRDLGYDPDHVLKPAQQAEGAGGPAEGGGAGGAPLPGTSDTVPQEQMGGPPVPAAVEGDVI